MKDSSNPYFLHRIQHFRLGLKEEKQNKKIKKIKKKTLPVENLYTGKGKIKCSNNSLKACICKDVLSETALSTERRLSRGGMCQTSQFKFCQSANSNTCQFARRYFAFLGQTMLFFCYK